MGGTGLSFDDEAYTARVRAAHEHAMLEEQVGRLETFIVDAGVQIPPGESVVDTAIRLLSGLYDRSRYVTRDEYDAACTMVADAHTQCGCEFPSGPAGAGGD